MKGPMGTPGFVERIIVEYARLSRGIIDTINQNLKQSQQSKPMLEQVRYITNEGGQRVGVLLDWETYDRLIHPLLLDGECLVGLSKPELEALAESQLALSDRDRLDDLLGRNADGRLSASEIEALDRLLERIDQLTILKTRARYSLKCLEN
ncbi:MAG: hypothetical protein EBE86_024675 [Hormoscilla sp. GUM202]|nr:hypothetical protein [Hormoscilla sp. GUM202]